MTEENNVSRKYMRCPCKPECSERTAECHGTCEKYSAWCEEEQIVKHRKWQEEQRRSMSDTKRKWLIRNMRRNKR